MRSAEVRPAAVAGTFYPGFPEELAGEVGGMLADAGMSPAPVPKAIIAPHVGYMYSGAVAAAAYARLRPAASRISRVVLLGPVHRVPVRGLALPAAAAFANPLGTVPVDLDAVRQLADLHQVCVSADAHALEHSLEVQLPFLQAVLGEFDVLPIAIGLAPPEQVARALDAVWNGADTLIVVSSDLSHYHT